MKKLLKFSVILLAVTLILGLAGCPSDDNDDDNQKGNNQTPTVADYDLGNLQQEVGSITAVTITPKAGKSGGAVTIYYSSSTTLPSTAGNYPVTFDVAAATGWNAATGLVAGTLVITQSEINWANEPSGTLTVLNNTSKDMILFQGQNPSANYILGGVRAGTTKTFDISDDVDDFEVGGYIVLRGMSDTEYTNNKSNLANAKIEYSAMATYGHNKKFRTEINPAYSGDYYFRVTNGGRIGIELRKDSPDGEKIGYLPALATNYNLYSSNSNSMTIFPVYVFFSNVTKTVTTIKPTSFADSVSVGPRPVTDSSITTVRFPNDPSLQWEQIIASITYPVAFITCTNNVANQDARFASASKVYIAQNGYDSLNSGETNTFEITATETGQTINLNMTLYGGTTTVPISQNSSTPVIKNGYDYTVTLSYNGSGSLTDGASYTATITEGVKRSVESEISSL